MTLERNRPIAVLYVLLFFNSFLPPIFTFQDLKIETIERKFEENNCGRKVVNGDSLHVHYTGKLAHNGLLFDSSFESQVPFQFEIGRRQVIRGWDQGLLDMCVGDKRRLYIPSRLAYGETGHEKVPPNSDLIFDIELLNIDQSFRPTNVFKSIDADGNGQLSRQEVGSYLKKQIPPDVSESEEIPQFDEDKMVEEIFQHEDKDRNGFISHDEFSGPKHDEL